MHQASAIDARRPHKEPRSELVDLIPALRAFSMTFCKDVNEADDLVQETLCKGIANIHRFEPGTRMKSWLFTIMRNTFYTRARLNARERPAPEACISAHPTSQPTQEWTLRQREVVEAVNALPTQQREVLILITILGMSYVETAEICGCAVGTVKSRLNRARQQLVHQLGETSARELLQSDGPR